MSDMGCFLLMLAVVGIALALPISAYLQSQAKEARKLQEANAEAAKKLKDANDAYRNVLDLLKKNPADPELRQRALEWGRHYSNLSRQSTGVTVFDELALSNDINAACAGAGRGTPIAQSALPISASIEERLSKLKSLQASSAITEEEYQERRRRILDEL